MFGPNHVFPVVMASVMAGVTKNKLVPPEESRPGLTKQLLCSKFKLDLLPARLKKTKKTSQFIKKKTLTMIKVLIIYIDRLKHMADIKSILTFVVVVVS